MRHIFWTPKIGLFHIRERQQGALPIGGELKRIGRLDAKAVFFLFCRDGRTTFFNSQPPANDLQFSNRKLLLPASSGGDELYFFSPMDVWLCAKRIWKSKKVGVTPNLWFMCEDTMQKPQNLIWKIWANHYIIKIKYFKSRISNCLRAIMRLVSMISQDSKI